jgi:hypothetical protein
MNSVIYDWNLERNLNRFHLEGNGELRIEGEALAIETFRLRPNAKATTVWLRDLILPDAFELAFTFRSTAENGNTMVIFNALPLGLRDIFDDPRPDAWYNDLTCFGKMQAHTVGFHRGVYDRPSVLRKVGGNVPEDWGSHPYGTPEWIHEDSTTAMSTVREPLTAADLGKPQRYMLRKQDGKILFFLNGEILHEYTDRLEYPYCDKLLQNGHMAFRNFSGPAVDVYESIVIKIL